MYQGKHNPSGFIWTQILQCWDPFSIMKACLAFACIESFNSLAIRSIVQNALWYLEMKEPTVFNAKWVKRRITSLYFFEEKAQVYQKLTPRTHQGLLTVGKPSFPYPRGGNPNWRCIHMRDTKTEENWQSLLFFSVGPLKQYKKCDQRIISRLAPIYLLFSLNHFWTSQKPSFIYIYICIYTLVLCIALKMWQ